MDQLKAACFHTHACVFVFGGATVPEVEGRARKSRLWMEGDGREGGDLLHVVTVVTHTLKHTL